MPTCFHGDPAGLRCLFLSFPSSDVQMYVCNKETYGYFPVPTRSHGTLQDEVESFTHTHLEVMGESRGQRALTNTREISLCSTVLAKGCEFACDEALTRTLGCDSPRLFVGFTDQYSNSSGKVKKKQFRHETAHNKVCGLF